MTLIENALRKMQQSALAAGQSSPRPQRPGVRTKQQIEPPTPASTEPVVRYRSAPPLDPVAMEHNKILPQLTDEVALSAYKILRTRLLQRLASNQWHSLVITGTQAQQGKTLTSVNLAIALAQDPHTSVFLVDLDLRRPQVAASLGMSIEHGLSQYLMGEVEADKIIYESGIARLAVIPNSIAVQNSSELLASQRMIDLQNLLANTSPRRIIIYDMPPLLLSDDVLAFAPNVDGVVLVATEGLTVRNSLANAKEILAEMNLIGVILNRSSERTEVDYY